jgi:CheY-like chemotaxis protein
MNKLKLLIVEDDKDFRDSYEKQIKLFNLDHKEFEIEAKYAENIEEAKTSLKSGQIDAAVIDLKLGNTDVDYKGNELVDIIKTNLRFPVFVVTANPEKIEEEKQNENGLFKIRIKGSEEGNFTAILQEFKKIHLTGITKILGKSGQIENYLNTIFWNHLSSSMDLWINDSSRDETQKEKSLLRYTLLHMQEYIDEEIEKYHPSEFHIIAPIKKEIFTGDIITLEGNRYVILTPSCDIVLRKDGTRNTDFILLCRIRDLKDIVKNYETLNAATSENNENRKRLINFIENKNQKYHFIPKSKSINAGLIDFQEKITIPEKVVTEMLKSKKMERISTISMPFLKDIISRYSNYYARQGSPDFNSNEIYGSLF